MGPVKRRGFFITFEGGDGSGKSTQAGFLAGWLRRRGRPFAHTWEVARSGGFEVFPGGQHCIPHDGGI
jgi:dTMP kinase